MTAWEYPEVKKILLMEPAIIFSGEHGVEGIKNFKGKVTIVVGSGPDAMGTDVGSKFFEYFTGTNKKEIVVGWWQ